MQLRPKQVVEANAVAEPKEIVEVRYEQARRTLHKDSNHICPTSTMTAVQYKRTESREMQMIRRKTIKPKNSQLFAKDSRMEANSFEASSEYCRKFIDNLMQISFMWHTYLGRISIANCRLKMTPNENPVNSVPSQSGWHHCTNVPTPRKWENAISKCDGASKN